MEVKPIFLRTLSMLGQRGAFGSAVLDLAGTDDRIVALTADLCNTSGLERFRKSHPGRFFNVGIAEQNLIGVAAGMASEGMVPFATTFANFAALRGCEQVRHFMGYMRENVKLVGFGAGFAFGMFGTTHYGVEDVAALRSINNLTILSPADCFEAYKATIAAAGHPGPVYMRLTGVANHPMVYRQDYAFEIGRANLLREGADVAVIATGSVVANALKAADLLSAGGIEAAVLDMHTIKPLDRAAVLSLAPGRLVVTVEEHSVTGGLGGAVADVLAEEGVASRLVKLGAGGDYPHAGDYGYMLGVHGLTAEGIAESIRNNLAK